MCHRKKPVTRLFLLCLAVLTVIFVCLYHSFLFGGKMYGYDDIGNDTIYQYLPSYKAELDLIWQGNTSGYFLQFGLGSYASNILTKYLNPSNIPLLLFGSANLHIGLLVSAYVKYVLICFFALLFFLRIFKNEKAAAVSALLWTFCGYNVLWGQHYQFLTAMVGFTASMYGVQLYLQEDRKWILTVPLLALLVGSSYYHTYIAAFFFAIYSITYLVIQKKRFWYIFKRIGILVLLALLTAGISASYLSGAVFGFLNSARTEQFVSTVTVDNLIYPIKTLMTIFSRVLSNNTIGVGNEFRGAGNYYEAVMLSVSLLFVFSAVFLLQGKYRRRTWALLVLSGVMLCTPLATQLLVFDAGTPRWTYLLCFLQVMTIGYALTEYFENSEQEETKKRAWKAVLIGDGVLAVMGAVLLACHYVVCKYYTGGGWLNKESCIIIVAILCLYHVAFFLLWKVKKAKTVIVFTMIAVELVVGNYATVNNRNAITVEQWYTQMYNDGTQGVAEWIKEQDNSIYRINKTYYSVYRADSTAQGYNGMGVYSSTNSSHLVNLARTWGDAHAGNWICFDGVDWFANNMLGVKYIISKAGQEMTEPGLEQIYDDGTFCVYENTNWSGFGYLYYDEMAEASLTGYTKGEWATLLTQYYYKTGNNDVPLAEVTDTKEIDLLPYLENIEGCQVVTSENGITITDANVDTQLQFSVPSVDGWKITGVKMELESPVSSVAQLLAVRQIAGKTMEHKSATDYYAGVDTIPLDILVDQPTSLYLQPTIAAGQTLKVRSLKLVLINEEQLSSQQTLQQENSVKDLAQDGNTFTGTVTNPADADAMLCLPLIYSKNWKATVDGEKVETVNINGGLTGIRIPSGAHSFELSYDDSSDTAWEAVKWCAVAGYLVMVLFWWKRERNLVKTKDQ